MTVVDYYSKKIGNKYKTYIYTVDVAFLAMVLFGRFVLVCFFN